MKMKKKNFAVLVLLFVFIPVFSQLNVYSNGNVGIARSNGATSAHLMIGNEGMVYPNYNIALYSNRQVKKSNFNIGVIGVEGPGTPLNSGRAIGVCGIAGNSTNGYNYGVLGALKGTQNGAGIFGTTYSGVGEYIPGLYAGYFDGNVMVTDNLNVNGTIIGTYLSPAVSLSNQARVLSVNREQQETQSEKFLGLNAISYYKSMAIDEKTSVGDTAIVERTMTKIAMQDMAKPHYALSLEEIENVYPELVYEQEDGTKVINYVEMIPLLVQSIGELKAEIADLKNVKEKQNSKAISDIKSSNMEMITSLSQNTPNPFTDITSVNVNIPTSSSKAILCIYDMSGKEIRQIIIKERGNTIIDIDADGLCAGMYLYSLIVDDKLIETRRMIVVKG